jgi:hypothetical protein
MRPLRPLLLPQVPCFIRPAPRGGGPLPPMAGGGQGASLRTASASALSRNTTLGGGGVGGGGGALPAPGAPLGSACTAVTVSDEDARGCQQLHLNIEACAVMPDLVLRTELPEVGGLQRVWACVGVWVGGGGRRGGGPVGPLVAPCPAPPPPLLSSSWACATHAACVYGGREGEEGRAP